MTKKELIAKMKEFIELQLTHKDEWYISDKGIAEHVLTQFAEHIGISPEAITTTAEQGPAEGHSSNDGRSVYSLD
jgi:hypothetical protein